MDRIRSRFVSSGATVNTASARSSSGSTSSGGGGSSATSWNENGSYARSPSRSTGTGCAGRAGRSGTAGSGGSGGATGGGSGSATSGGGTSSSAYSSPGGAVTSLTIVKGGPSASTAKWTAAAAAIPAQNQAWDRSLKLALASLRPAPAGDPVTLRASIRHLTPVDPSWSPRGGRRRSRRASEVGGGFAAPRPAAAPAFSGPLQRAAVGPAVAVQDGRGGGRAQAARPRAWLLYGRRLLAEGGLSSPPRSTRPAC